MTKVITYGTFDLLHHGHLRLLKRAKALGDYLIVGVTTDDFDKVRGKINVKQSLMERIEGVRATGLADEIIAEEYEGQKIDDIKRFNIDIFTVGSDWIGRFDYLEEFCKVVYLERTEGISSSEIRSQNRQIRLGLVGESERMIEKHKNECEYVNGICIAGICSDNDKLLQKIRENPTKSYDELLDVVDALYIVSNPKKHYEQIKKALLKKKHVLCDSPITLSIKEHKELNELAKKQDCILMDGLKTAYSTAYARLLLLVKSGKIGQVYSVDTTCTSLTQMNENSWNSICEWGPVALLPIFDIFGVDYKSKNIISHLDKNGNDEFTKISFIYKNAVASVKVGKGVKSEGELVISGTKGYIYVPAPWWKTDYFEIRYENASENKRYFYQLDGEGIRYELSAFVRSIEAKKNLDHVGKHISEAFCKIIEDFNNKVDFIEI